MNHSHSVSCMNCLVYCFSIWRLVLGQDPSADPRSSCVQVAPSFQVLCSASAGLAFSALDPVFWSFPGNSHQVKAGAIMVTPSFVCLFLEKHRNTENSCFIYFFLCVFSSHLSCKGSSWHYKFFMCRNGNMPPSHFEFTFQWKRGILLPVLTVLTHDLLSFPLRTDGTLDGNSWFPDSCMLDSFLQSHDGNSCFLTQRTIKSFLFLYADPTQVLCYK